MVFTQYPAGKAPDATMASIDEILAWSFFANLPFQLFLSLRARSVEIKSISTLYGVTLNPGQGWRCLMCYFTCPSTLALLHRSSENFISGGCISLSGWKKHTKYTALLHVHVFTPLDIETFGAYREEATQLVGELEMRFAAFASISWQLRSSLFLNSNSVIMTCNPERQCCREPRVSSRFCRSTKQYIRIILVYRDNIHSHSNTKY